MFIYTYRRLLLISIITVLGNTTEEIKSLPSYQGFIGAINTPNSEVIPEGEFEFLYSNQVSNFPSSHNFNTYRDTKGVDNFFLNMGILPNLDLSLRYSQGADNYYLRDRIISLKYKLPFIPHNLLDAAFGIQDIGGGAQHLKSKYMTVSKKINTLRTTIGYAQGESLGALDGTFGSIEYQPLSWLQIAGEYDTHEYNGAIKANYLTEIGKQKINLGLMAKSSLDYNKVYLGGYLNFPFNDKNTPLKVSSTNFTKSPFHLNDLSNTHSTIKNDTLWFEYENSLYSSNDIDALGMVLGTLSTTTKASSIVVSIKKSNSTQYSLKINTKKYKDFLRSGVYTKNLIEFVKPSNSDGKINNSNRFKPLLTIQPDFVIVDGSEYAKIDYSVALQAELSLRLAKGTTISGRYHIPVAISDNFKEGGIFDYRNRNKTSADIDQLLLSQSLQIDTPSPWMNLIQVGRFDNELDGVSFESAISDMSGKHLLLLKLAYLEDGLGLKDMDRYYEETREEKLLSYRYYMDGLNSNIKITGGEFLYGDEGIELGFKRYFSDISLGFDLAYTKHDYKGTNYLGRLTLSMPFGTSKRLKTDYLDIESGDIKYTRRKTIVAKGHASYALPHHLKEIENSFTLENYHLDKERFHPSYIKTNYNRLRNVFLMNQ